MFTTFSVCDSVDGKPLVAFHFLEISGTGLFALFSKSVNEIWACILWSQSL
jgi:hypothetical protein